MEGALIRKHYFNLFPKSEAYSEPSETSKMECFEEKVNSFEPLTSFAKRSILYIWQGSKYASETD